MYNSFFFVMFMYIYYLEFSMYIISARPVLEMHNCIPFFDGKILGASQVMKTRISAVRSPTCCKMAHMSIWEREHRLLTKLLVYTKLLDI